MAKSLIICLCLILPLTACEERPLLAVGQLESDRVELVAESSEPIVTITVQEGDSLLAGATLLGQDMDRIDIRIREAQANTVQIQAVLDELIKGPRMETIAAAKASLREAEVERDFRGREFDRVVGLRERNLTSIESIDNAEKYLQSARARFELVSAQLAELEAGTRPERIEQTRAQLEQAQAQLESLLFDKSRLITKAPVAGLLDSLPFEVGERPRVGDVLAVLLTGEQPFARVYIPEPLRVGISIGTQLSVSVDGLDQPLLGRVRRIASEASFTPYFALTERDRSRLSYPAEIELPPSETRLPDGVPVQVVFE